MPAEAGIQIRFRSGTLSGVERCEAYLDPGRPCGAWLCHDAGVTVCAFARCKGGVNGAGLLGAAEEALDVG